MTGFLDSGLIESSGGYQLQRSLRLRKSATAYLNRTFVAPTDGKKHTIHFPYKRGELGTAQTILTGGNNSNDFAYIGWLATDKLTIQQFDAGVQTLDWTSTEVFRDPTAHGFLTIQWDTTQATGTNRLIVSKNGVAIPGTFNVGPIAQNTLGRINSAATHYVGRYISAANYADMLLGGQLIIVDGQALTPSSFGQIDPTTGQWTAKKYTGTYGTNGFYLDFKDNSSTANLCLDRSGNGNNWTPNNISLTAGATYDSMLDVPLAYGTTDRGNYCTLNPLQTSANNTISQGNMRVVGSVSPWRSTGTTETLLPGMKVYVELLCEAQTTNGYMMAGVVKAAEANDYLTSYISNRFAYQSDGNRWPGTVPGWASYSSGVTIAFAIDVDARTIAVYRNNVLQGTVTENALADPCMVMVCINESGNSWQVNFGQRPFAYTPPTGFKALHTGNLPAPSIIKPNKHFDVHLISGDGTASRSFSYFGFKPDFLWNKTRNDVYNHNLIDSVRGVGVRLQSDLTGAESSLSNGVLSFDANGYTVGDYTAINGSGKSIVNWLWKAGGAAVTNNAGSISSQVSANVAAGFSIVTYTGTGANATVGHGLGVAPKMVIVKERSVSGSWFVYHSSSNATPQNYILALDQTIAATASADKWNNTAPTSTTFALGTSTGTNQSGQTFVAYCFAEIPGYSKIGSYIGNGSTDGPFVFCGFKPRYVMVKNITDAGSNWCIFDSARNTYNVVNGQLYPDLSNAESTATASLDFTANGFKMRAASNLSLNSNGSGYIFMAFAEAPFKYSNAR